MEHFNVQDRNNMVILTWPQATNQTNVRVSSRHRCLDKYKHYVTRRCGEHGWMPDRKNIFCSYVIDEYKIRTQCPPGYRTFPGVLDDIKICFNITSERPWSNACLSSGSSLTLNELNITERLSIHRQLSTYSPGAGPPIWLPARQMWLKKSINSLQHSKRINNQTVANSIQWTLAGIHGLQVQLSNIELEYFDGCLLTQWQPTNEISRVLTNCNDKNPMICLYNQHEPTMLQLSCPPGYRTTRYATYQNICIKIHRLATPFPAERLNDHFVTENICENVFSIHSGSTLYIMQELARIEKLNAADRCLFKTIPDKVIVNVNDWMQMDMSDVDFVNWSFNTTIPVESENHILVATSTGEWVWEAGSVTCAICFVKNNILTPTMELYKSDKNLIVRIQKEEFLWRDHRRNNGFSCFAFTYAKNQIEMVDFIYHHSDGQTKVYNIATVGEGRYWCTGLQVRSFEVIETDIVHIQRLTQFALLVKRPAFMPAAATSSSTRSFNAIVVRFRNFLASFMDPQHLQIESVTLQLTATDVILFHVSVLVQSDDFREFEENRLNVSDNLLAVYYVREMLNEIRLATNDSSLFQILSLNSTMFCLPVSISQLNEINWTGARLGQYITSVEFCLLLTGLPITKRCTGDSLFGGMWMPSPEKFECRNDLQSIVTYNLHNLTNSYLTSENTSQVLLRMVDIVFDSEYSYLIGADVFYVSQILMDVANYMQTYPLSDDDVLEVLRLYDRLLMVNESITVAAAPLNTTNVLLYTLDTILESVTWSDLRYYDLEIDDGVASVVQPRVSSFIIYPLLTNITGVAVINGSNASAAHEWTEYDIQYLYQNDTIADILAIPNLVIGSYIPAPLLASLDDPSLYIIITLFINDVLFQNNDVYLSDRYVNSSGSIISIILPGINDILPHKLPIFLQPNRRNKNDNENVCGHWNYVDGWAINGCALSVLSATSSTILCECTHLTHFAYLFHGHNSIPPEHIIKLNLITLIGCSLSLIGVFGIYLSALLFRQWRKLCSTKFLLQFSTAIAFEMIMLAFVNTETNSFLLLMSDQILGCIALGALLHYSVLVTFFWMFIIAYMQYMRYVKVFHKLKTTHFFFKSSLFGWAIPIIPIILVLLIDPMSYVPNLDVYSYKICYPSGYALYFAVMTPISLITFANFVIFFLVIKSLATESELIRRNRDKSTIMSQLRLSIFLFFLLGLTWIFAFLSTATTGLVFTYMFCVTATLQGFILFFYFIVMDPTVRKLWIGLFSRMCGKSK